GGGFDAFVTQLNASGTALLYSTYLGGSSGDRGNGITVDGRGQAYVTGSTTSANFPTTPGAFQTTLNGFGDAFVTKFALGPPVPPGPPLALQDDIPGSLLVFPLFDVIGITQTQNQTKIRLTCNGVTGTRVRVTYVCQPQGPSTTSAFCPSFDEAWDCTPHQTLVLDVGTELAGVCPTGQGYIVAFAEAQCTTAAATFNASSQTCATATGGSLPLGEFGPISYNQLFGSYYLYYNGGSASGLTCGSVPCGPPPAGPVPDVEAANAIGIQSPHPAFSFLGNDTGGALSLTFGPTTAFDYVALPKTLETDFAAPGATLIAGPSTFPPFIPPDTVSGTELQTNIILLNLNYSQF